LDYTKCILDLVSFFKEIRDFKYFATKIKTPYFCFDEPFPEKYPVGRDVDIVAHPDDYEKIKEVVEKFCLSHKMIYKVIVDSKTHTRHRLESEEYFILPNATSKDKLRNGLPLTKLHFQIDISSIKDNDYFGIVISPILEDMENPTFINGVKILSDKNETLMRCLFYNNSKSIHHKNFIYSHRKLINEKWILDKNIWDSVCRILS
jgi:hypothetical protein